MAKVQHLYSLTSGHVPASLLRGQMAINMPDQTVYALTPDGQVKAISRGTAGVANASGLTGVHIPVNYMPVAQLAPGYTQAQLTAKFNIGTSTVSLGTIPIFALGRTWYIPPQTCAVSPIGAYLLWLNTPARTALLSPMTAATSTSGGFNAINGNFNMVVWSDGQTYPWFYLPNWQGQQNGAPGVTPGDCSWFRVSPFKTFGAIPVSQGFPGAAATAYWGP